MFFMLITTYVAVFNNWSLYVLVLVHVGMYMYIYISYHTYISYKDLSPPAF